jgi:predicted permease
VRADVDDEIRFDIDMRARDLIREGLSLEEARSRATREFGDLEGTRRYCEEVDMQIEAEVRRSNFMEDLWADLRVAWRGMRRTPVFAAVVLATLALGVGANTAVFSVVRRVLIAPLPFRAPNELYRLYTAASATDGDNDKLSAIELTTLATESKSISGVTLFGNYQGAMYSDDQTAEPWQLVMVAPSFFDVLGVRPIAGRVFDASDFATGAPSVGLITYQIWQRTFAGERSIVGRTVQLNGTPLTIIGVLPEHFVGPTFSADILRPLNVAGILARPPYARARIWRSVVRLKPNVSLEAFRSELGILRSRIQADHPEIKNAGVFLPTPLHEAIVGHAGAVLRLVMGGALIVLLAACVNIAGLFLSRAAARRREIGMRTALGAARGRLVRQVLAETLVYGVVGGALGVLLSIVLKAALLRVAGPMLPALGEVRLDTSVLAFAIGASIVCGIAFGVLPAVAATRIDVRDALGGSGTRSASRGATASRASRLLVSAQVAFAVVLMVGASLFVRTFKTLIDTDLGYETSNHQATFFLGLGARYRERATQTAFIESVLQRVRAVPGLVSAGTTVTGPWNGTWRNIAFRIEGRPTDGDEAPTVVLATASAEFFAAAGIPVRLGRPFDAGDRPGSAPVIVISESMAHRYWPSTNPVGQRLRINLNGGAPADSVQPHEIVGVVSDVKQDAMTEGMPTLYVSEEQHQINGGAFVIRTTGDAAEALKTVKEIVASLDPRVPVISPRSMNDVLSTLVRRQNVAMTLVGMFAVLALLLAGLGVYGVMAYSVAARTREFGIRSALGASRLSILGLVLRDGLATTLAGLAAGVAIAAAMSRLVASLLVGVTAHDPISFVAAMVLLCAAALVACAVPARSATRVQPVDALRLD